MQKECESSPSMRQLTSLLLKQLAKASLAARQDWQSKQAEVAKSRWAVRFRRRNLQDKTFSQRRPSQILNQLTSLKGSSWLKSAIKPCVTDSEALQPERAAATEFTVSKTKEIWDRLLALNASAKALNRYVADPTNSKVDWYQQFFHRWACQNFHSLLLNHQIQLRSDGNRWSRHRLHLHLKDKVATECTARTTGIGIFDGGIPSRCWGINRVARKYGLMTSAELRAKVSVLENAYIWEKMLIMMSGWNEETGLWFRCYMFNGYEWPHAINLWSQYWSPEKLSGVDFNGRRHHYGSHHGVRWRSGSNMPAKELQCHPHYRKSSNSKQIRQEGQGSTAYDAALQGQSTGSKYLLSCPPFL